MRVEDWVREEIRSANCELRDAQRRLAYQNIVKIPHGCAAEKGRQQFDVLRRSCFVEGNPDRARTQSAQIAARLCGVL